MIEFAPLNLRDVLFVCENMRKADWAEVINLLPSWIETPEQIAMMVMQGSSAGLVAKIDGEPAAVAQFAEILDGTWRAGMFGTDRFREVGAAFLAELMGDVFSFILDRGAVYCDAYADTLHPEAHKLLEFLGFKRRAILPGYGSRGRDIALYVLTKRDTENVHWDGRRRKLATASANTVAAGSGGR